MNVKFCKHKAELWNTLHSQFGDDTGMVYMEQLFLLSKKNKCCANCGDKDNLISQKSIMVPSVSNYYLCQSCHDFYQQKNA